MRNSGFDGFPGSGQVHVDHVCPVCFAGAVECQAAVADSGVRADDVQSTQLLNTTVGGGLDGDVVADVDLGSHDATIQLLDQVRSLREVI